MLRVAVVGNVDDGKSTLIGRLLLDTASVYRDQMDAVEQASRRLRRAATDLSLVMDGLQAEREQAITIDVGFRRFSLPSYEVILADVPGHEQYTRNMVTGASTADLLLLLVDVRHGLRTQSRRHALLASLLGVREVIVLVNKMDLVGFDQAPFVELCEEHQRFCARLQLSSVSYLPISALSGDNVAVPAQTMDWYEGPTLLDKLQSVEVRPQVVSSDLRLPVQLVQRDGVDFRGYAGTVRSGVVRRGDDVVVMPAGRASQVRRLLRRGKDIDEASAPDSVTVVLQDEVDVARGNVLVHPGGEPLVVRALQATVVWLAEEPLRRGRLVELRCEASSVRARVVALDHVIDPDTLSNRDGDQLALNEVGRVQIQCLQDFVCDPFVRNSRTGAMLLVDPGSGDTLAAATVDGSADGEASPQPVSRNITRQAGHVSQGDRRRLLGHGAATLWLTGLSGAGKTTIAHALEQRLLTTGHLAFVLDGDNLRHGLNRDLGFAPRDRRENIRRVAEVASLIQASGAIVLCSFISPYAVDRDSARRIVGDGFLEVFVDAPLAVCEARDTKGLYAKARAGEITDFTGVSAPYEPPGDPDLRLRSDQHGVEACVEHLLSLLRRQNVLR